MLELTQPLMRQNEVNSELLIVCSAIVLTRCSSRGP